MDSLLRAVVARREAEHEAHILSAPAKSLPKEMRGTRTPKMTAARVRELRHEAQAGAGVFELAPKYGLARSTTQKIVDGKSWPFAGGPIRERVQRLDPVSTARLRGAVARGGGR